MIKSHLKICLTKLLAVLVVRCYPMPVHCLAEVKCVHTQMLGGEWRTEKEQLSLDYLLVRFILPAWQVGKWKILVVIDLGQVCVKQFHTDNVVGRLFASSTPPSSTPPPQSPPPSGVWRGTHCTCGSGRSGGGGDSQTEIIVFNSSPLDAHIYSHFVKDNL